jgi:hypothetical protein
MKHLLVDYLTLYCQHQHAREAASEANRLDSLLYNCLLEMRAKITPQMPKDVHCYDMGTHVLIVSGGDIDVRKLEKPPESI